MYRVQYCLFFLQDGVTEEQYPYSISYRNSNVNSTRKFGTSTFAIRPTKSARKVEKLKQVWWKCNMY